MLIVKCSMGAVMWEGHTHPSNWLCVYKLGASNLVVSGKWDNSNICALKYYFEIEDNIFKALAHM